jgi:hypothetical protein
MFKAYAYLQFRLELLKKMKLLYKYLKMLSFKFVETFFFFSLAITFALIITLVYHFKKRMENMETKCDTMFDIVQNLAKEVLGFKQHNYDEQPIFSTSPQMEQVTYDNLDDVVNNNTNVDEESSDEESSGEESSGEESSGEDGSDEDGSDEDGSDEDGSDEEEDGVSNVTNNLTNGKITIPDNEEIDNIMAVDLTGTSKLDEPLDVSQFLDEDASNIEELLNVSEIDKIADDIIGNNLSKSALRKLKLSALKQIAKGKQITIDDAMTKNAIIDILLKN